jgi:hypothetical protein
MEKGEVVGGGRLITTRSYDNAHPDSFWSRSKWFEQYLDERRPKAANIEWYPKRSEFIEVFFARGSFYSSDDTRYICSELVLPDRFDSDTRQIEEFYHRKTGYFKWCKAGVEI